MKPGHFREHRRHVFPQVVSTGQLLPVVNGRLTGGHKPCQPRVKNIDVDVKIFDAVIFHSGVNIGALPNGSADGHSGRPPARGFAPGKSLPRASDCGPAGKAGLGGGTQKT